MDDEVTAFLNKHPEVESVDLFAADIPGNLFGKNYPVDDIKKIAERGTTTPRALFVRGSNGRFFNVFGFGVVDGDPDCAVQLVPNSLRFCPWSKKPKAQALISTTYTDVPNPAEPRHVLRSILDDLRGDGLVPMVAFEYEFYLFDAKRWDNGELLPAINPYKGTADRPLMSSIERLEDFTEILSDLSAAARIQGIRTGVVSAELGPGQFELNLHHCNDALQAADEAVCFKHLVKQVAKQHGMIASFMAKPLINEAGNGMHIHISMPGLDGVNVFGPGTEKTGTLLHAIGGLLAVLPESMAVFAPNINSYKRFAAWQSAAISRTWGYENRSAAFRVPMCEPGQWRVEVRIPGADANPYLALATALTGMRHGITGKIDPGKPIETTVSERDKGLPFDLVTALRLMQDSSIYEKALPGYFRDIYCIHRQQELNAFANHVGAHELDWYL